MIDVRYFLIEINVIRCGGFTSAPNHTIVFHYFGTRSSLLYLRYERSQLPCVYVSLYREVLLKLIRSSNRRGVMPAIFGHPIIHAPSYTDQFFIISIRASSYKCFIVVHSNGRAPLLLLLPLRCPARSRILDFHSYPRWG